MADKNNAPAVPNVPLLPFEKARMGQGIPDKEARLVAAFDGAGDGQPREDEEPAEDDELEDEEDVEEEDAEEEDDEEGEEEEDEEDDLFEIPGQKKPVTSKELIAGYLRQSDYTRKTTDVANRRKALEQEQGQVREARETLAEKLKVVEQALEQATPPEPDWDKLQKEDPAEFAKQWAFHERLKRRKDVVKAEQEKLAKEQQEEYGKQRTKVLAEESEKLLEALPEWADEKVATKEQQEISAFLSGLGFTEDQIDSVYDHRMVLLFRDAMQYRQLVAEGKRISRRKGKKDRPSLRPGGREDVPTSKRRRSKKVYAANREKLAKSGRVDDARDAIFDLIDGGIIS